MPIASGAAGRVTTWTTDGLKGKTKPTGNYDSYLQRYQEQRKRNKTSLLQGAQDSTNPIQENDGSRERNPRENGSSKDPTLGKPSRGERSKKSLFCVLL